MSNDWYTIILMEKFIRKHKVPILLFVVTLLGLFFYTYRLKETQLFRNDPARDTLKILRIWQNKEITLIGPPISFTQHTIQEAYLGSLFIYIGLVGSLLTNWSALGPVLPNIFFYTLSIPFFYLIVSRLSNSFWIQSLATIIYALSPITVTHARFFWNPNLIIPASVFFWYLILKETKSRTGVVINYFFAGNIAGLMFNFHYLVVVPLIVYIATLFIKRKNIAGFYILIGLLVGSTPIIIFELRNNFYLTKALIFNVFKGNTPGSLDAGNGIYYFFNIFWSVFGLRQTEIDFPTPFLSLISDPLLYITTLIIIILIFLRRNPSEKKYTVFWPMIASAILMTIYFSSGNPLRLRYLFSIYPILIFIIVYILYRLSFWIVILLFIPIFITSITIITTQLSLQKNFISLSLIETICQEIVKDNPIGSYNITENLKGDARAMSFRYCVTKDTKVKPQDEYSYNNLTSLYVISPSLDKIYKENRWEFYASAPWKLMETSDFGEVKLFKFVHEYDKP